MNDSTYRISLDINEHGTQVVLNAKLSDTGRKIYITLRAGGTPYHIADDCYAVFAATKPDGAILYNACTIENNEIIYEFTGQTCSAVGRIRCEIKLYGKDEKLITSPRFALLVDGTVYPDGRVESQDEFSALTQMVSDTLTTQALTREAAEDAKSATNTANVAAENANKAAKKATDAAANLTCNNVTDEKYFDIDYDGVVSLKPEYQNGGSKNAELPEVIVIPDAIGGTAVSALAESMFEKNLRVKSVTIPSWVRAIPVKFANRALNLEELKGTENVEDLGKVAFQYTRIKKALFPNLKTISGIGAFNNAANLLVADIGNVAGNLPDYTFYACESLSLLKGGAGITSISANGFFATRSLKNLSLLSGVNSIGASAFVLSRVDYDWWNALFISVGASGTPAKFNPDKWWDGAMPENWNGCQNPLGSTFHQHNPEWENVQIKGSEDDTYGTGCTEVSAAHIYSALSGVTLDSPITFVEDIVGAVDNGRLLVPTGTEGGNAAYTFADMKTWLEGIGEGFECELLKWNNAVLGKVYDALNEGALVLTGINPGHAGVIYGAASNGEMLVLDSSPYKYLLGIYKAETFQQPIWSFATQGAGVMIVRKVE